MAIMIPDICREKHNNAEYILFNQFRDGLSDEFIVFYSTRTLTPNLDGKLRYGETDFIILHKRLGLLVLEAKSGKKINVSRDTWLRMDDGKVIQNPFEQARKNSFKIRKKLKNYLKKRKIPSRINCTHIPFAVALPQCNEIDGTPPPEAEPKITLFRANCNLDSIEDSIRKVFNEYSFLEHSLFDREFEAVKKVLGYYPYSYCEKPVPDIDFEKDQFINLEDSQKRILETNLNRLILVEGVSGSGKTIVAREQALRWSQEKKRVLLLVFNIPIAELLQIELKDLDGVDVFNFHGLCETVVNQIGGEWKVPEDFERQDDFYTYDAPTLMEAALPGFKSFYGTYDAIVVDEAQDFHLYWWPIIRELFTDPENPHLCIFYDPDQNLRKRELDFDQIRKGVFSDAGDWARYRLKKNWRNTRAIANYMYETCNIKNVELHEHTPMGEAPVEEWVSSVREEREWIRKQLDQLIRIEKIKKKDIVILSRYRFEKYIFAQNPTLGTFTIIDYETAEGTDGICYATLDRFKGLERPCVILVGFNRRPIKPKSRPLSRAEKRRFYVGVSRASNRLFVLFHRKRRIRITGLDESVTFEMLQEIFSHFGRIYYMGELKPSKIMEETQVAHISFESIQAARRAVQQMNGYDLCGRKIVVELKG